jgi:hypothetical protein
MFSAPAPATPSCSCGGGCPRCQAKSKSGVSKPGDAMERHADSTADRVMSGGAALMSTPTMAESAGTPDSSLSMRLSGHGAPLDRATRSFFESRFQTDLSNVRIHTDASAASLAHSYEARAFTYGRDIVFNSHEYAPHSHAGKRLLAHELTHVLQQRQMPSVARQVMRTPYAGCDKATTGVDDADVRIDDARKQAKRMLARAQSGFPRLSSKALNALHRHFHCPSNDEMRVVIKTLDLIDQALPTVPISCIGGKNPDCKATATTRGKVTAKGIELCPAAFRDDARQYKLAASLIQGAALQAGFSDACPISDASCYDDFTIDSGTMMGNAYSYTWFVIERAGYSVPQPPTIPCSPTYTGDNVVVPPSAATDATTIRALSGFEQHPAGSIVQQVFSDRSGNRFIYSDTVAGAKAYTSDGRKRVYIP